MFMKKKKFLFLLLTAVLLTAAAHATNKQMVTVRFKVEARAYRDHFGSGTADIENTATRLLVQALKQNIGFVDFMDGAGAADGYHLTISLSPPDPSRGVALQRVILFASLSGPGVDPDKRIPFAWMKYRDAASECSSVDDDSHCRLPERDELISELRVLLSSASYADLVNNVLRHVPFLSSGTFLAQPVTGWVLPFRQSEVCLDKLTQLLVNSDIQTAVATVPAVQFLAEMVGPYTPAPENVFGLFLRAENDEGKTKEQLLKQFPGGAVVTGVYVVKYRFLGPNCGGAISPPSDGGSQ